MTPSQIPRDRWIGLALVLLLAIGIGAGLAGCGSDAEAQSVTDAISFEYPTARVDGSALPITDIATATIQWGGTASGPFNGGSVDLTAPAKTASIPRTGTGVGTRCFVVFVTTKATAPGGAITGVPTQPICRTIAAQPSAPTGLTVTGG